MDINVIIFLIILAFPCILVFILNNKKNKALAELAQAKENELEARRVAAAAEERLRPITDIEAFAKQVLENAEHEAQTLKDNTAREASSLKKEAQSLKDKAAHIFDAAQKEASALSKQTELASQQIIEQANQKALEIAGEALELKDKAGHYKTIVNAMRNTIEGYRDEYIIPNKSVLDELAEEFSYKDAGAKLKEARKHSSYMVKNNLAADCDYAEQNRRNQAIIFAIDAFNGKVDTTLAKVKHDNFGTLQQEIKDAYTLVNYNGKPFRDARITLGYLHARLEELKWAVATSELQRLEREEQKAIREQMREEERAQREIEKAIQAAEKEERLLQTALEKARKELAAASDEQKLQFEAQLAELEEKLKEAESRGIRALSMAQQTRRGHVYVISNIGSFGEQVFKVGMTRRLDPLDRVKELGDASVPFEFDVHAMIYSEDAPALEKQLHREFELQAVNRINPRKEFFKLPLKQIREAVENYGLNEVHWTMKADAAEYFETLSILNKEKGITQIKNEETVAA